jgi:hypothetical protein
MSRSSGIAAASVASASSVQGVGVMTIMCSIPSAAAATHRPMNSWLDSPVSRRVLSVF